MKTNHIFIGLLLSCMILSSYAQNTTCCGQNIIRVQGNGQTRIKPNIAILYASLNQNGKTATEALSNLDTQLSQILSVLQLNGVGQNDISTSSISVYPQYNYTNGSSVIIGYTVYVSLTITIRGIDTNSQKIARIIDGLASAGVTSISGITYDTVDPNAGKAVARTNAWNDALSKAKQYAQLSGRKLGKVLVIQEASYNYYPYYYSASGQSSTPVSLNIGVVASGASPDLPIGYILVTVVVIVTWQLV